MVASAIVEPASPLSVWLGAFGYIAGGLAVLCAVVGGLFWLDLAKRHGGSDQAHAARFTGATMLLAAASVVLIIVTK